MTDIIVTTPKSELKTSEKEAEYARQHEDAIYFRKMRNRPQSAGTFWHIRESKLSRYAVHVVVSAVA